jgi:hypothetical protein
MESMLCEENMRSSKKINRFEGLMFETLGIFLKGSENGG